MIEDALPVIIAAFTSGAVGIAVKAWFDRRNNVDQIDVDRDQMVFAQLERVVERLSSEVERLDKAREEDLRERERDRERITSLESESRLYRWVLSEVLKRLRRVSTEVEAAAVIDFILTHIPNLGGGPPSKE